MHTAVLFSEFGLSHLLLVCSFDLILNALNFIAAANRYFSNSFPGHKQQIFWKAYYGKE